MTSKIEAKVTHRFRSSADRVYDAWLTPEKARHWMEAALLKCGLAGDVRRIDIDARVGGSFFFSDMRDGAETKHWNWPCALPRARRPAAAWGHGWLCSGPWPTDWSTAAFAHAWAGACASATRAAPLCPPTWPASCWAPRFMCWKGTVSPRPRRSSPPTVTRTLARAPWGGPFPGWRSPLPPMARS